jgi:hypothetical protein
VFYLGWAKNKSVNLRGDSGGGGGEGIINILSEIYL